MNQIDAQINILSESDHGQMEANLLMDSKNSILLHYYQSQNGKVDYFRYIRSCIKLEKEMIMMIDGGNRTVDSIIFETESNIANLTNEREKILTVRNSVEEPDYLYQQQQVQATIGEMVNMTLNNVEWARFGVIDVHLARWKHDQRLCTNGRTLSPVTSIDDIRNWCSKLADILLKVLKQIILTHKHFVGLGYKEEHTILYEITEWQNWTKILLDRLITQSIIFIDHPSQVLKSYKTT